MAPTDKKAGANLSPEKPAPYLNKAKKPPKKAPSKPSKAPKKPAGSGKTKRWEKRDVYKAWLTGDYPKYAMLSKASGVPISTIERWASKGKWQSIAKIVLEKAEAKMIERLSDQKAKLLVEAQARRLRRAAQLDELGGRAIEKLLAKKDAKLTPHEGMRAVTMAAALEAPVVGINTAEDTGPEPDPDKPIDKMDEKEREQKRRHLETLINAAKRRKPTPATNPKPKTKKP